VRQELLTLRERIETELGDIEHTAQRLIWESLEGTEGGCKG
jgi:hypothetical protein